MRKPHWLKANRKNEIPVHCIFYDTETKSYDKEEGIEEARLWFGWACYIRRYRDQTWGEPTWCRFRTSSALWRWVAQYCKPKRRIYLFAHNQGFDFTVVKGFKWARKLGWKCTERILGDPPTIIRFRKDGCTLCFIDTLNYFRMPLKELGKFIGHDKLDFPDDDTDPEHWDRYCRADVDIIRLAMLNFWGLVVEHDLGNFAYTLPSQAFAAFRHRFMSTPIFIDDNEEAAELSRKGYVGARTEAFQLGKIEESVTCLDINSQYPFIMATTPVPTRLVGIVTRTNVEELSNWCGMHCVVADVTLHTTVPFYPKKVPGWTIFPVGRFRTVLNTPELMEAMKLGAIETVHAAAVYERAIIFKDYVDFFYNQRMEAKARGDETLSTLLKLFMNSLYGKFGQNGIVFEHKYKVNNDDVKTWIEWDADKKTIHRYRQFAGVVEELQRESESRESFPAIAGHITSAARVLLADYIATAKPENTIYVDTDSLFVNDRGARNLSGRISESQLGWLKEEWKSDEVTIFGAKDYDRGSVLKRKGIKKNATKIDESTYALDQFRGFKGMIQDGDLDHMEIRKVIKHLTRVYSKGTVDPQGRVYPLRFPHPDFPDQ